MCAFPASELDRKQAHSASCTLNQDTLTSLQTPMIKETLPGGRCAHGDSGCLVKTQCLGLKGKLFHRSCGIFSVCPLWALAENCLSFLKGCHTGASLLHCTSQVMAGYIRKLHWQKVFQQALTDFPIRRVYPCCVDANKHLACLGFWALYPFKLEFFWPSILVDAYGLDCLC